MSMLRIPCRDSLIEHHNLIWPSRERDQYGCNVPALAVNMAVMRRKEHGKHKIKGRARPLHKGARRISLA
jgi:hypothetical protein